MEKALQKIETLAEIVEFFSYAWYFILVHITWEVQNKKKTEGYKLTNFCVLVSKPLKVTGTMVWKRRLSQLQ